MPVDHYQNNESMPTVEEAMKIYRELQRAKNPHSPLSNPYEKDPLDLSVERYGDNFSTFEIVCMQKGFRFPLEI
jgi:hypothetical protein